MARSAKKPAHSSKTPVSTLKSPAKGKKPKAAKPASASSGLPVPAPKALDSSGTSKPSKPDSGTKQSRVLSMLGSPEGATIAAMMQATGWQQHSVRGFLAGVVRKRLGLQLTSKAVDSTRVYQIGGGGDTKAHSRHAKGRVA